MKLSHVERNPLHLVEHAIGIVIAGQCASSEDCYGLALLPVPPG